MTNLCGEHPGWWGSQQANKCEEQGVTARLHPQHTLPFPSGHKKYLQLQLAQQCSPADGTVRNRSGITHYGQSVINGLDGRGSVPGGDKDLSMI